MLSFLNPTVLLALVAATIPLLIHLLNRRKIERIPFSTIHFLKQLEKKQMRNLRIRQLLLLILRTLIIVFLVLAFARPSIKTHGGGLLAERSAIDAVIILDNSLSLNEAQLTGTLIEKLRQSFLALEPAFKERDRISIIQSTHPATVLVSQEDYQSSLWERTLQKILPNYLKSDLVSAIILALQQFRQSPYLNREIYIISDFQQDAFDGKAIQQVLGEAGNQNIKIFAIPLFHGNFENISVDSVEVLNRLIEINQPLRIRVILHNHHPEKRLTTLTSVVISGSRVAQKNIDLSPGQQRSVEFQINLAENGFVQGFVETESDALMEDNRGYFNFYVPKKIRVLHLLVGDPASSYIPLIIQPARRRGIFDYQIQQKSNWVNLNFLDQDVVIVEGADDIPETLLNRLRHFVRQGGGVLIFPGQHISVSQYVRFFREFNLGSIGEIYGQPGRTDQFLSLSKVDWTDPIFEGLFSRNQQKLNPIEIYASYKLKVDRRARFLLALSDGSPFLVRTSLRKGIVFLMASPLNTDWTELPLKGFIVPLLYRMIYFAGTQRVIDRQSIRCGEVYQQLFANLDAPYNFHLTGPQQQEEKLTPQFKGSNVWLKIFNTAVPGNYQILHDGKPLVVFSVNHWKEESELTFYSEKTLMEIFPDVVFIKDLNNLVARIQQSRFGKELWRHFLALAFVLLFIEMIVARTGIKYTIA